MTELLGEESVHKLESEVARALRRRSADESVLAGALQELSPFSSRLCRTLERAVADLVKRSSFQRPLYAGAARALVACAEQAAVPLLTLALSHAEGGGLATLSAASMARRGDLAAPLGRLVTGRHLELVFAAEIARVVRGESSGDRLVQLAPMLKESSRIALCSEIFVPLLFQPPLPRTIAASLKLLRESERHLGRWLVLAEVAQFAGDAGPGEQAGSKRREGTKPSRAAWALLSWALGSGKAPTLRPTLQVLARLSHRPTSERDPSFLFRMAEARLPCVRPILEHMVQTTELTDAGSIRAALLLARDYSVPEVLEQLQSAARSRRQESLRGLAAAALFDAGCRDLASRLADELVHSKKLSTMSWAALIRAGGAGKLPRLVTETSFRRVQRGWVQ